MITKICQCGAEFKVWPYQVKGGRGKHCSRRCYEVSKHGSVPWNKNKKYSLKHDKQFKKGGVPWNKGKKMSTESKEKMQRALKGKIPWNRGLSGCYSESSLEKMSRAQAGEKSFRWKGGITTQNLLDRMKFIHEVRPTVLKRDHYRCQECGAKKSLHVEHVKPWSKYPELRFNLDNCKTLCRSCHYFVTFGRQLSSQSSTWGLRGKEEYCYGQ